MKKTRRIVTIAAATIALTAGLTPAASAQNLGDLIGGAGAVNQIIDTFPCEVLTPGLHNTGLANENTTRSELATTLRDSANLSKLDPTLAYFGIAYSNRIADRALKCGAVQPDPQQDILTQLQNLSSNLSS